MGNSHPHLTQEKKALSLFDKEELKNLEKIWQEMADRNDGQGIRKQEFLAWISLPGLLGERMFKCFLGDDKDADSIDYDKFIEGLGVACRGTEKEKTEFLFKMLDHHNSNKITRDDLTTFLNQIPWTELHKYDALINAKSRKNKNTMSKNSSTGNLAGIVEANSPEVPAVEPDTDRKSFCEHVDEFNNNDVVNQAFACDVKELKYLDLIEFELWLRLNPGMLEYIESALPVSAKRLNGETPRSSSHKLSLLSPDSLAGAPLSRTSSYDPISNANLSLNSAHSPRNSDTHHHSDQVSSSSKITASNHNNKNVSSFFPTAELGQLRLFRQGSISDHMADSDPTDDFSRIDNNCDSPQGFEDNTHYHFSDKDKVAKALLVQAFKTAENELLRSHIAAILEVCENHKPLVQELSHQANDEMFEQLHMDEIFTEGLVSTEGAGNIEKKERKGYLFKEGNIFHMKKKRYYRLKKNCLYYFSDEEDNSPKGVIFLAGSIVVKVNSKDQESRGYFAFEIKHQDLLAGEDHKHEHRILYCQSSKDREEWVSDLQHAANVVPVEEDYITLRQIDKGRFSVVYEAVHKEDRIHRAIKRIDKNTIQEEEKELLRTEIVVLKLMKHPNIITLCGLYESKDHLDIALEYMPGGDLFSRIKNQRRFKENEAANLVRPLLEAVAYIHDLGIVHRDIKPENILCGEKKEDGLASFDDLKVADFGLSKMILPDEKLFSACGTLSYVAPEVLEQKGYGKEVDIWAIGIIFFLIVVGKFPFEGSNPNDVFKDQTTDQIEKKISPNIWNGLTADAQDFMKGLLNKDPAKRLTARLALKHPFIAKESALKRRPTVVLNNAVPTSRQNGGGGSPHSSAENVGSLTFTGMNSKT